MTLKAQFNRKFHQSLDRPNSRLEISVLTGISLLTLDNVYKSAIRYPYTNNYDCLNRAMSLPVFATIKVYEYALGHQRLNLFL